MNKPATEFA